MAWTDVRFPAWIIIPVRPWRQQILLYCLAGGSRVKRLWLWWLRWVGVGFQCLLGSVQTPHFTRIIDTWWMGALGNFNQFTMSPALDKNLAQECCLSLFRGVYMFAFLLAFIRVQQKRTAQDGACMSASSRMKREAYIWSFNRVPLKMSVTLPVSQKSFKWYHLRQIIWFCAAASGATEPFFTFAVELPQQLQTALINYTLCSN